MSASDDEREHYRAADACATKRREDRATYRRRSQEHIR